MILRPAATQKYVMWDYKVVLLYFPKEISMLCISFWIWGCALVQECVGTGFIGGVKSAQSLCHSRRGSHQLPLLSLGHLENIPSSSGGSGMDLRCPSQNLILRSEVLGATGKGMKQPKANIWWAGMDKKNKGKNPFGSSWGLEWCRAVVNGHSPRFPLPWSTIDCSEITMPLKFTLPINQCRGKCWRL